MVPSTAIDRGLDAYRRRSWGEAWECLFEADRESGLDAGNLRRAAIAAYLTGRASECIDFWTRAHQAFLDRDLRQEAADCAFWMGLILFEHGDHAQGSGWIGRARRLVEESGDTDWAVRGLLLVPEALQHLREGRPEKAGELFLRASEMGKDLQNRDLASLGMLGRGQSLIRQGAIPDGTALLDEAMVAVISGEVSPIVTGIIYCAVLDTCHKIFDLQRAQEWTEAFTQWCASQPDLIPYRGQCLVRRAEIMQLHGRWPDAMNEARRACELPRPSTPKAGGAAHYRQAELYRLQGNFGKAEEQYTTASKLGYDPHPGLALLRLAQGETDAALKAIRQVEKKVQEPVARAKILPAFIEIAIEAGEPDAARSAAGELAEIAGRLHSPFLEGMAAYARGAIALAGDRFEDALEHLLDAWSSLKRFEGSYESAKTRLLIGRAYRSLGDHDTGEMELNAARWMFEQMGAARDREQVESMLGGQETGNRYGLTPRELEVLELLATGKTNKAIAGQLYISERTVDRHVSNIFSKLDVPSRAAATAFAYEHDLV